MFIRGDASQFLEVFVTMGVIDLTLYVADDGSPEVAALRPPAKEASGTDVSAPPPVVGTSLRVSPAFAINFPKNTKLFQLN